MSSPAIHTSGFSLSAQTGCDLFLGDSAHVLKTLPGSYIDLTVTSPPYDNLRAYKGFTFDFETIAQELYRVTKPGGVVVWVVGDATIKGSETGTSFRQALYFKECGFNLHDTMIYEKDGINFPDANRYQQCFEFMFVFSKGRPAALNLISDHKNVSAGRNMKGSTNRCADGTSKPRKNQDRITGEYGVRWNVWRMTPERGPLRKAHPAIFPERLAEDHILSWSNPGDLVLDPFLGSGTTGKMALKNNRRFAGIEIAPEYLDIAKCRLDGVNAGSELSSFLPLPAAPNFPDLQAVN